MRCAQIICVHLSCTSYKYVREMINSACMVIIDKVMHVHYLCFYENITGEV